MSTIAENLAGVRARIEQACREAGRDPASVTLVCVTKTVAPEAIRLAYQAGARDFGENYAQDLRDKATALQDLKELRWHFIGGLQRNKVKYVVGRASLVHSVDSLELLQAIEQRAARLGLTQPLLLEVNLGGEASKSGVGEEELPALLDALSGCPHCVCQGLMTMPPLFDEPEAARPYFARLRRLLSAEASRRRPDLDLRHLSMGMSGDFEVAVAEGATLVRVGTAIFGPRC
jgi:pyridoxal phosphate enzyme (YggS family)